MKILLFIHAFISTIFGELKNLKLCCLLIRNGLFPWSPEIRKIRKENNDFLIYMLISKPSKNKKSHQRNT